MHITVDLKSIVHFTFYWVLINFNIYLNLIDDPCINKCSFFQDAVIIH